MSFVRSKNGAILVVAGIIILAGIVGVAVYFSTSVHSEGRPSNGTTTRPPSTTNPETTTLLFASTTDGGILQLDPKSGNYKTLVYEGIYLVKTFDFYRQNQTLFYGTAKPEEPLKSNGSYEYSMENSAKWMKTAMAIDQVTSRIYVLDGVAEKLYVLDKQTGYYAVVLTDLDEPRDIVIDSERRKMFILQKSSIITVYLDGQLYKVIEENDGITAFAIDHKNATLYYTCNYGGENYIRYLKYEESMSVGQLTVIQRNILSMTVLDDKLFYISTRQNGTDKALNYCYLSDECGHFETAEMEDEQALRLLQIKSYDYVEKEIVNPCANNNGGCPHLCISSKNVEQYVCKCNAGYQLDTESKYCSRVQDYLMYVQDNKIKGRTLSGERSFVDMDLDLEILDAQKDKDIYFDYDSHSNMLVYASGSKVHYRDLSNGIEWSFKDESGCEVIPAIDWVSKNLYNIRNCNNAVKVNFCSVRKLYQQTKNEKTLWNHDAGSIKSFVVLPNRGKVMFTLQGESVDETLLHVGYSNGQGAYPSSYETHETGLTVDFEKELIYFLMSPPLKSSGSDFDSLNITDIVDVGSVKNPRLISAFQGQLYVANAKEIWQLGEGGKNAKMLMRAKDEIQSFRIYSKKLQPIDAKNPCAVNNGGCQRYCFAVPSTRSGAGLERECGCDDIENLNSDGESCSDKEDV